MREVHYRTFEPDLEIMPRSKGGDGRTLYGIAVPWRKPVEIPSLRIREQFAPGAFTAQERDAGRVKLAREHIKFGGVLIGRLEHMRSDAAGQYVEARVARTDAGDETIALVEDGALNEWSVGFLERQNRNVGGIVERVTAHMRELAVTMAGVYGPAAAVAGVRSAEDGGVDLTRRYLPGRPVDAALSNLDRARQILAGLPTMPGV